MNNETKAFYEKVGQKYADFQEKNYLKLQNLFDEISWLQFSEFLPENKNSKILDAGCGGGGWSLRLAKMGYRNLTLIDFSSSCIEGAKRIFSNHNLLDSGRFIVSDISDLSPLKDNEFDFIFCERDPLEYCTADQDGAFSELTRVLSSGSILTFSAGTKYRRKQKLLSLGKFNEFFEFEKTNIVSSEEGNLRPFDRKRILDLFEKNQITKIKISGRLTIADEIPENINEIIYRNPALKEKLIQMELKFQENEELADFSSHIFAAGKKQ